MPVFRPHRVAEATRRFPRAASLVAVTLSVAVASCGGGSPVGEGIRPTGMRVLAANANTIGFAPGSVRAFQCITGALAAVLDFSDGRAGNYSNRVQWVSTDEGIVKVSSIDRPIFAPNGTAFAPGTLVPIAPGTATVRALYSDFETDTIVSVGPADSITMRRLVYGDRVPVTAPKSMGIETQEQFSVGVTYDGVERDVTDFIQWGIGSPGIASVSTGGLVTAQGVGSTELRGTLALCNRDISTTINVANILGVAMSLEFGSDPLMIGNSERVFMTATLDNGDTQDVSGQATYTSTSPAQFSFLFGQYANNLVNPLNAGTGVIQGNLLNRYPATDISLTVESSTLTDIQITPSIGVIRAGSDQIVKFKATGTYANGLVQDVTRAVTWGVDDAKLGQVSNQRATAGFASSIGGPSNTGQTFVTAVGSSNSSAPITAQRLVFDSVQNPATP